MASSVDLAFGGNVIVVAAVDRNRVPIDQDGPKEAWAAGAINYLAIRNLQIEHQLALEIVSMNGEFTLDELSSVNPNTDSVRTNRGGVDLPAQVAYPYTCGQ